MNDTKLDLNGIKTNSNARNTLPGEVANLNALDGHFNLNDVSAKFLDRSAKLNARFANLNDQVPFADLFLEFE